MRRSVMNDKSAAFLDLSSLVQFSPEVLPGFCFNDQLVGFIFDLRARYDHVLGVLPLEDMERRVDVRRHLEGSLGASVVYLPRTEKLEVLYEERRRRGIDLDRSVLYGAPGDEMQWATYLRTEIRHYREYPRHLASFPLSLL